MSATEARRATAQAAVALLYTCVVLTVIEYWLHPVRLEERLRGWGAGTMPPVSLKAGSLWSLSTVLGYGVVPMLLVVFWHRESLATIGCRLRGFGRHLLVYLALFACMVPVILFVARRDDFLSAYPFVASATESRQDFFLWELAYVAQFFALEAFFRGFLLFTLEKGVRRSGDLRDDRAVLHDPLPQATAGSVRRHHRGSDPRLARPAVPVLVRRRDPAQPGGRDHGFPGGVAGGLVLAGPLRDGARQRSMRSSCWASSGFSSCSRSRVRRAAGRSPCIL